MEAYANWGFHFMEDKLIDDPNYFYRETAFLDYHNGLVMHALKDGEYVWYTIFTTELGDIELSIMAGTKYNTAMVRLSYYDKANSEKVRNAAMDDL